ncbi:hypothetical protein [Bradyrhizobium campsiandrae]|nr:hypothetical protein [Bradyrhizobium campsiandrae]
MIAFNLVVLITFGAFALGTLCGYGVRAAKSARRRASDRRRRL